MKLVEKRPSASKRPARVWLATTLFALTLFGAGATAFPIKIVQNQNSVPASAKRFVGTWKGKLHAIDKTEQVLIFKIEDGRLTGTQREILFSKEEQVSSYLSRTPESARYVNLPELSVTGDTITWITRIKVPTDQEPVAEMEILNRVYFIGDDVIQVEKIGEKELVDKNGQRGSAKMHVGYHLKKEK